MPSFLVDILNNHLSGHSSDWMFPTPTGDHVRSYSSWMKNYWRPAIQRSGIDYATPHALRHGAAAIMIDLGANPVTIQQRLGHKDIRTTLGTYGHLFPHQERN